MVRLVRSPDGAVLPDLFGKLPGRGVHLCPVRKCFRTASERKAFGRAFRAKVDEVDPDALADSFVAGARQQTKALLATALRSGWLVAGRDAVREALAGGRLALVLLAEDAGASLQRQMVRVLAHHSVPAWKMMDKKACGAFHGGRPVAVLGVAHRGLAARLRLEIERIQSLGRAGGSGLGEGLSQLTPELVHGMMPQTRAGAPS